MALNGARDLRGLGRANIARQFGISPAASYGDTDMPHWFDQINQAFPWIDPEQHPLFCLLILVAPVLIRFAVLASSGNGNHPDKD